MLKHVFSVLSQGAALDVYTGNLSIFDTVTEISVEKLPVHFPTLALSMTLKKDLNPFSGHILIHLVQPDGASSLLTRGEVKLDADKRVMRVVSRFQTIGIHQYGTYKFVVSITDTNNQKVLESVVELDCLKLFKPIMGPTSPTIQ